jgi:hypothetical protein
MSRKFIYPRSTRLKMRVAKLGKSLSERHRRAIAKGVRAYLAKRLVRHER